MGDKVDLLNICELKMFHHHLFHSRTRMRTFDLLFSLAWTKHTSKQRTTFSLKKQTTTLHHGSHVSKLLKRCTVIQNCLRSLAPEFSERLSSSLMQPRRFLVWSLCSLHKIPVMHATWGNLNAIQDRQAAAGYKEKCKIVSKCLFKKIKHRLQMQGQIVLQLLLELK